VAPARRSALRAQIVILVVAFLVAGVGAAVWSRTVASDDDGVETVSLDRASAAEVAPNLLTRDHGGEAFGEVVVLTAVGDEYRLASDGRPMVVNFWYSACGPCSRELTWFGQLASELGDSVRFVGVNPEDEADRMVDYAAERGVDYELYRDDDYAAQDHFEIVGFPLTLFVDADGTIVGQANELTDGELRALVGALTG
jgi:thiol-disulfide isomerase/thioredoxin